MFCSANHNELIASVCKCDEIMLGHFVTYSSWIYRVFHSYWPKVIFMPFKAMDFSEIRHGHSLVYEKYEKILASVESVALKILTSLTALFHVIGFHSLNFQPNVFSQCHESPWLFAVHFPI